MHLLELEAKGFKSFADKMKLSFSRGTTCIVGPNGAGKSNLLDAIRFALGEVAFKPLRTSSLEDLIFSGAQNRPPLSFAYVSLTFDNQAGELPIPTSEVRVIRKIYRDGESEFLLNGQTVKLRDIQQLFAGTGLGKESYAFVFQGQVERVLSARPEERRLLIEEAASLSRLFFKKKEAKLKLEKTRTQLIRLHDILASLKSQIPSLKRQAARAEKTKEVKQELIALEKIWAGHQKVQWAKAQESLELKSQEHRQQMENALREIHLLQEKTKELKERRRELLANAKAQDQEKEECLQEIEKINRQLQSLCQREREQDLLCDERANTFAYLEVQKIEKEKKRQSQLAMESKLNEKREHLSRKHQRLDTFQKKIETLHGEAQSAYNRSQAARLEQEKRQMEQANRRLFLEQMKKELLEQEKTLTSEKERVSNERRKLLQLYAKAEERATALKKKRADFSHALAYLQAVRTKQEDLLNTEKDRNQTLREELIRQESKSKLNEGAPNPLHLAELVRKSPHQSHFLGTLKDLVQETQHRGMESYLKQYGEALVFQGWENALKAAEWLKLQNLPFLIYSLEPDPLLSPIQVFLSHFAVGQTLPSQKTVSPFLTEDGLVLQGPTIWHLPQHPAHQNILQELQELYTSSLESLGKRKRVLETTESEITEKISKIHALETEEIVLSNEKKAREKDLAESIAREKELQELLHSLQLKKISLQEDETEPGSEFTPSPQDALEALLRKAEKASQRVLEKRRQLEQEEKNSELQKIALQAQMADLDQEIAKLSKEKQEMLQKILEWRRARKEGQKEKIFFQEALESLTKKLETLNQNAKLARQQLSEMDAQVEKWQEEEAAAQEKRRSIERGLWELKSASDSLLRDREEAERYLLQEVELNLDAIAPVQELPTEAASFQSHLQTLRERHRKLGGVDEEAIQLFKEREKESSDLEIQIQDLEQTVEEIKKGIHSIDIEAAKEFTRTLEKVRAAFREIFQELFTGYQGDLLLTGEGHIFERGLEIVVSTPHARRQNLQLLSGGEKSLVAIAFLLAILKARPSPFVVLDEVDAALDELNVERFTQLLKSFPDKQFLVVTHNRRTMEIADYLYGVTQETPGVTKAVSLDLSNLPQPKPSQV